MAKVSTNITIDAETKVQAQALLSDFGMDLSTAVNIFLKQMLYEGSFPFTIKRGETPNEETLAAIREVQRMKKNPSLGKAYTDVDEMMKELLS